MRKDMTEPKKCANGCGCALQGADINNVCESCRTMIADQLEIALALMRASFEAKKKKGWNRYL